MSADDAETDHVLNLLDCLWFQYSLFTSSPARATPPMKKSSNANGSPTSVLLVQDNSTICPTKSSSSSSSSNSRKKMIRRSTSRSLSEVELKGFMDLGFVFQDHQTAGDSKLLLSSGMNGATHVEAWDDCLKHRRRRRHPLMVGLIRLGENEVELKHQIRVWAHSVASTVQS